MRLRSGVSRQKAWIINRVDQLTNYKAIKTANYETKVSTNKAVKQATEELTAMEPLLHKCSIPSPHDILEYLINEREGGKFCSTKFPTSTEYLQSIGALGWFKDEPVRTTIPDEDSNEDVAEDAANEPAAAPTTTTTPTTQVTNTATCFGVNKDCEVLPTMDLKVIDIREGGTHKVYDIQVDQEESFLANGVVAHNCLISHGTMGFLKERLMDVSDIFTVHICKLCGLFSVVNPEEDGVRSCTGCDNYSEFMELRIPYACKLLMQELEGMMITPRFNVHHS
jgi:DNA-directed RNA polymerase II subunit RPB2